MSTSTTDQSQGGTITFRCVPDKDRLIQPLRNEDDDEDQDERKYARSNAAWQKQAWRRLESKKSWFSGMTSLVAGIFFGLIVLYILSRSGTNAQEVNLSQVVTEAQGHVGETPYSSPIVSTPTPIVSSSTLVEPHVCHTNEIFPDLETTFPDIQNAIVEIHKLGPHNDLDGLIVKLEHVAKAFGGPRGSFDTRIPGVIHYLNKHLEGHFRLDNHLGTYTSFQIWEGDVLTPYVLKRSYYAYAETVFRTSRIERLTQNAKHVARVYHVFGLGGVKNWNKLVNKGSLYYAWYLEERLGPLEIVPGVDIDTIRTITRHVVMGMRELEKDGIEISAFLTIETIGYETVVDDEGNETKIYKIANSGLGYINMPRGGRENRVSIGWMLKAMNKKMGTWGSAKAMINAAPKGFSKRPYFDSIGESPECIDFITFCYATSRDGRISDGITWENVLETHPFLTNGTMSPEARETGRLKHLVTFY